MKKDIYERLETFALSTISFTKYLPHDFEHQYIKRQLIRSACSAGANATEADGATSKREFIHKMNIAQRELKESLYWLSLLN